MSTSESDEVQSEEEHQISEQLLSTLLTYPYYLASFPFTGLTAPVVTLLLPFLHSGFFFFPVHRVLAAR